MRTLLHHVFTSIVLFFVVLPTHAGEESLIVANSKAWKPYSYLDENDEPQGILVDIWNAYGAANNIEIEFKLVDWNDSLELVRDGKADIHAGLLWSKKRSQFLSYGPKIVRLDTQLYVSRTLPETDPIHILTGETHHVIGAVKGAYEMEFIQTQYPQATLKPFNNNKLMIDAALSGEIDVFVADIQVANYYLNSSAKQTEFLPAKFLYSGELYVATAIDNQELLAQVTERFTRVKEQDRERIFSKWMHIETVYPKYLFVSLLGLILLLLAGYATSLRIAVKAKTKQLEKANAELSLLAKTDSLTGTYNRRSLLTILDAHQKNSDPLTVMVLDIDDFKRINDQFGHVVGDEVICTVVDAIKLLLKADHILARIGGEEFAVVLSNVSREESYTLAETIVSTVAALQIANVELRPVTVSLGCVYYSNAKQYENIAVADKLMYQAKKQGKGQAIMKAL